MTPAANILPIAGDLNFPVLPAMPEDTTALHARLLCRLLRGAAVTHNEWQRDAGSSRLAASVFKLRCAGWLVIGERVSVQTRDAGRMASVARYSLDPDQRAAAAWSPVVEEFLAAVDEFEAGR